jgi:hypothetical protein
MNLELDHGPERMSSGKGQYGSYPETDTIPSTAQMTSTLCMNSVGIFGLDAMVRRMDSAR